jgi:hypothetical protein
VIIGLSSSLLSTKSTKNADLSRSAAAVGFHSYTKWETGKTINYNVTYRLIVSVVILLQAKRKEP